VLQIIFFWGKFSFQLAYCSAFIKFYQMAEMEQWSLRTIITYFVLFCIQFGSILQVMNDYLLFTMHVIQIHNANAREFCRKLNWYLYICHRWHNDGKHKRERLIWNWLGFLLKDFTVFAKNMMKRILSCPIGYFFLLEFVFNSNKKLAKDWLCFV
jgi:hypothetical protein